MSNYKLMNYKLMNYKLMNYKLIILVIIILIIFYSINILLKKYNNEINKKEHYLTYFLPFYDNKITELTKMYDNNDDKKNFFKKKFLYKPLIYIDF